MAKTPNITQPLAQPGIASAEHGLVILDGPDGVAITMTAAAAAQTGHSLITAAQLAAQQIPEPGSDADSQR